MHHAAFDVRMFTSVFVTLLVIMDPIGTIPLFLALTSGRSARARRRLAWQAVLVAVSVIAVFAVFGQQILRYLGITVPALQGAGGLLLILVALELLTGKQEQPDDIPNVNVALVPLTVCDVTLLEKSALVDSSIWYCVCGFVVAVHEIV